MNTLTMWLLCLGLAYGLFAIGAVLTCLIAKWGE